MNPFAPLYRHCNTGTNEAKRDFLPEFPRLIDVEVTNACNFRCLMCPTGNHAMTRASGFMEARTMHALVEQCPPYTGIRFIGWGEPTLHPMFADYIGYAGGAKLLTHVNTNGSNPDAIEDAITGGLDSLKFSFQGVDRASYAEMRNTDYFDGLLLAVHSADDVRQTFGELRPFIHVSTTTTYETPEQIEAFRAMFEPIADMVTVGKTIFSHMDMNAVRLRPDEMARLERLRVFEPELSHPVPCPEVNDKLTVQWDGSVRVCCNDFDGQTNLGNVNDTPLHEIWRHKVIEDYRGRLAQGEYSGPLCGQCWDYQGLSA